MAKLSNFNPSKRVILHGLPKTGKTTLAGELSKNFNLLWFDLEQGAETLKKLPIEQQERINLITLRDSASFPVAVDTLLQLWKKGSGNICVTHGKYDCGLCKKEGREVESVDFSKLTAQDIVVVDTITQLSHSVLAHITKDKPVTYKPERDDWGGTRKHTEYLASQWQASNFNLICIAHCIEATLEDGRTKLVPNFGSANMSAEVAKFFSDVIYCEVVNKSHKAYSSSTASNSFLSGSRSGFKIEDLAIPSLVPLFEGVGGNSNVEIKEIAGEIQKPAVVTTPATNALANLKALRGK